jgi:hypothetical protein
MERPYVQSLMPRRTSFLAYVVAAGLSILQTVEADAQAINGWSLPRPLPRNTLIQPPGRGCAPPSEDEEIVVCGRRQDNSRYRLTPTRGGFDPNGPEESVSRERHRWMEGGEAGTGSCSAVGAGGWTGCFARAVRRSQEQNAR